MVLIDFIYLCFFIYWRIVALQCCVSLYSKVNQSYVYINPLFFGFPFRSQESTEWSSLSYTVGFHWLSLLYMVSVVYICQPHSPNSSPHPRFSPPWCPYICSLHLCLYFCFANKIIYTIFARFLIYTLKLKVSQSCPTLCDSMDCSPPGSQEWVTISFSRRSSQTRDWTWISCTEGRFFTVCATKIRYFFFSFWLTSFCMTDSRFMHISKNNPISFLFMAEYYSIVCMYRIFILSSIDGHLGCFHVLAIVNSSAMNIGVHVFLNYGFLWVYAQKWVFWVTW